MLAARQNTLVHTQNEIIDKQHRMPHNRNDKHNNNKSKKHNNPTMTSKKNHKKSKNFTNEKLQKTFHK